MFGRGRRYLASGAGLSRGGGRTLGHATRAGLPVAVILAAGLAGCGGPAAPAALAVRCAGHTLPGPDTDEVFENDPVLPPAPTAVTGIPHPSGTLQVRTLPDAIDPGNPGFGYAAARQSWGVQMISASAGGKPLWSAALSVPKGVSSSEPDLSLVAHDGYAIAAGGNEGQYIGAVSSAGRSGPACAVPRFAATDTHVELLPRAGLVLLSNPTSSQQSTGSGDDFWLDAYSTATSQRVWSVSSGSSVAGHDPDYIVSGDTVYLWQDDQTRVAAFDARTGQQLWATGFSTADQYAGDNGLLGVSGGTVYAMADTSSPKTLVVALSAASGATRWKRMVPQASSPSDVAITQVGQGHILLGDSDNNQEYLLNARTGATLVTAKVGSKASGQNDGLQVVHPAGHVAIAIPDDGVIHVLSANPAVSRAIPIPQGANVRVTVADTEAYVLVPQAGGSVRGYDLATGKLLWTVPVPGSGAESALDAFNGAFVVQGNVSGGGTVYR